LAQTAIAPFVVGAIVVDVATRHRHTKLTVAEGPRRTIRVVVATLQIHALIAQAHPPLGAIPIVVAADVRRHER
jgi:hypothetical protein